MPSAKGGDHDSGVSRRMAGTFMTQMQDIQEPVFWVFTANGVEDLHEAFLADDRVDGVVYVHMPGPEARASCWKMYLKKFFPQEIGTKPFPGHLPTAFAQVFDEFKKIKKVNPVYWADRFVAALLCMHGETRVKSLARLEEQDSNVHQTVIGQMIDDDGWTPARIKQTCRLSRKREKSLTAMAKTMAREQRGLQRAINKLERWAAAEAIDAETGEAYVSPEDRNEETGEVTRVRNTHSGKVRRKVRKMKDD